MTTEKCDITPNTIVGDLLRDYPELEDKLIEIAPVFSKLKNPVLRKTVAKVATLKQAAQIAGMPVAMLINKLRSEVNMGQIDIEHDKEEIKEKPDWVSEGKIVNEYDASIDIENGLHPAAKVTREILSLNENDIYLLITPFLPAPLIKIIEDKGYKTYSEQIDNQTWHTYIVRK
ncbi:hypothetical protein MROS_1111 [Melioribacter roseus P3M-2]|jgi:hypothetical protein|uniref:DUF1858 domain-containing protein n=1 Tax=Melioribacter roseus (strain DSM 23840 / JCM 17771 / VKM B-2668 / P3M-2) TaxID=1191523 RepID=I6Z5B8_MELRP|nr:DUF1858 domain-containing protein [Melioribacter roseus]AFN74350.1 hypothetical protein MROS_1111 [Melioribacter roseus P3M-2]